MMRVLLGIGSLTCVWFLCGSLNAQAKDAVPQKLRWQQPVLGHGDTVEGAKRDAVRKAVAVVEEVYRQQNPLVRSLEITEEYVKANLIADEGRSGEDVKIQLNDVDHVFKTWSVTLRSDTERMLRAEERQTIAYGMMVFVGILLTVGAGYVKLDEFTYRRYTTWLRVAGGGVVATLLAGSWWLLQRGW